MDTELNEIPDKCLSSYFILLTILLVATSTELHGHEYNEIETLLAEKGENQTITERKSGYQKSLGLGGPSSTEGLLNEASEVNIPIFRIKWFDDILKPWFDFKSRLNSTYGLQFGVSYTHLYMNASDVLADNDDEAGVGILRVFGKWALFDREGDNTGTLVFSADNRSLSTGTSPADLGFAAGYQGIPGTLFKNTDTVLVDLNWQQKLNSGSSGIIIGRYDPNDYLDVLGYANPWSSFQNLAILFNTSIALTDTSSGFGLGHIFSDQFFMLATVNDANGNVSNVDFFNNGSEFYTAGEVGWTISKKQRHFNKISLHGWHVDSREDDGLPESYGVTASGNYTKEKTWMLFSRIGWSDGDAPLVNKSITVGGLCYVQKRSDLIGIGVNWGDPSDGALKNQVTTELFYRLQLAQNLAVTPSVQMVLDPALNPEEDELWFGGIRVRVTL